MYGCFYKTIKGKIYHTAVKRNSVHHELWESSLKVLSLMCFIIKGGKSVNVTLQNWRTTVSRLSVTVIKGKIELIFNFCSIV